MDDDVQITRYRDSIAAQVFDQARIDVRRETERFVTEQLQRHCEKYGLEMAGPVLIDWHLTAEVRTRKAS